MANRERSVVLRFLAQPADVNFGGKVHGGTVMKWIDQAGYACAVGWSGRYCVTVWVGGIRFLQPILVGSMVEVRARVIHTGRTSLHVAIEVAASDLKDPGFSKATDCVVVFVATNDHGKPAEVPAWTPVTEEELADKAMALRLMEVSKQLSPDNARQPAAAGASASS